MKLNRGKTTIEAEKSQWPCDHCEEDTSYEIFMGYKKQYSVYYKCLKCLSKDLPKVAVKIASSDK